jgi:YidC/Oxa1 family membrane protein insertase
MVAMQPSKEQQARQEFLRDSLQKVEQVKQSQVAAQVQQAQLTDTLAATTVAVSDSAASQQLQAEFGDFAISAKGTDKSFVLENDKIKLTLGLKGGKPLSVEIKNYQRHDSSDLVLFNDSANVFGLNFFVNNRQVSTNDLFFETTSPEVVLAKESSKKITLRLNAGKDRYIEYEYALEPGSYLVSYKVKLNGISELANLRNNPLILDWRIQANALERGDTWEKDNTMLDYKFREDEDVESLLSSKEKEEKEFTTSLKWFAFKQQFFSSILIADTYFEDGKLSCERTHEQDSKTVMAYGASLTLATDGEKVQTIPFHFFFGPNKYNLLKNIELPNSETLSLQKIIPIFGFVIGYINRFLIIPIFSFLSGFNISMGIIILLMTLVIKLLLFPFTYKSYVSMAEMRVLKPQIDDINARIPADKAMDRQQATMALYKKAGVSPLGGCLPMLFQFPILIAMFKFFPASIELRGQAFLWAQDLSTYDVLVNLPFTIPFYGAHISGFTLLMTLSSLLTMKLNNQQMGTSSQMPGMQTMMYLMPVMFMFMFNSYSAGLSYYYFLSNLVTYGQTALIRQFVNENKILLRLEANKKKPVKKSKFQARLEDMAKKQKK